MCGNSLRWNAESRDRLDSDHHQLKGHSCENQEKALSWGTESSVSSACKEAAPLPSLGRVSFPPPPTPWRQSRVWDCGNKVGDGLQSCSPVTTHSCGARNLQDPTWSPWLPRGTQLGLYSFLPFFEVTMSCSFHRHGNCTSRGDVVRS